MRIEIFHDGKQAVTFDGHVVEVFGVLGEGATTRWHPALIHKMTVKTSRKGKRQLEANMHTGGAFLFPLDDQTAQMAEQLIAEVNKVRAAEYGLGPIQS